MWAFASATSATARGPGVHAHEVDRVAGPRALPGDLPASAEDQCALVGEAVEPVVAREVHPVCGRERGGRPKRVDPPSLAPGRQIEERDVSCGIPRRRQEDVPSRDEDAIQGLSDGPLPAQVAGGGVNRDETPLDQAEEWHRRGRGAIGLHGPSMPCERTRLQGTRARRPGDRAASLVRGATRAARTTTLMTCPCTPVLVARLMQTRDGCSFPRMSRTSRRARATRPAGGRAHVPARAHGVRLRGSVGRRRPAGRRPRRGPVRRALERSARATARWALTHRSTRATGPKTRPETRVPGICVCTDTLAQVAGTCEFEVADRPIRCVKDITDSAAPVTLDLFRSCITGPPPSWTPGLTPTRIEQCDCTPGEARRLCVAYR